MRLPRYAPVIALVCLLPLTAPLEADETPASLKGLEKWFSRYRSQKINLLVPRAGIIGSGPRLVSNRALEEMNSYFLAAAAENSIEAAERLLKIATFYFHHAPDAELRRYARLAALRPFRVRDRAIDALAAIRNAGVREWIAKEVLKDGSGSRAAHRREAAARSLGRMGWKPALYPLRGTLGDPEPAVRVAGIHAVEAIGGESALAIIAPALRDTQAEVRAAAAETHRRRAFAITAERHTPEFEGLAYRLGEMLEDPSWWVRLSAVEGLSKLRSASAIAPLIEVHRREYNRAFKEPNARVRDLAYATLVSFTGQSIAHNDLAGWDRWWNNVGSGFKVRMPPREPVTGHRYSPRFYGLSLKSRRIVFVLDTSGSMGSPTSFGTTPALASKLEAVKKELRSALALLDSRTSFDIIFFSVGVNRWRGELVPATLENVRDAMEFVERKSAGGGTNLYGALAKALTMKKPGVPDPACGADVDEIVLLSDGWPSVGDIIEPDAILELITAANRRARTRIHTISVETPTVQAARGTSIVGFMEQIAARNHGETRRVAFE